MTYHVLFNPFAGNGNGESSAHELDAQWAKDKTLHYTDMTKIKSYTDFFASVNAGDPIVLAGGDGTINRFINDTEGLSFPNEILYYPVGSGNDFLHDLGMERGVEPFPIGQYLTQLPTVTVKGKTYRFLNGIGYGIDGYCCEVGDKLRKTSKKPVNYAGIAIKGLLFHFKPANAKITVDGKPYAYRKVWLCPTMNGRYYGGGMNIAPEQKRKNPEKTVSVVLMFGSGKLKTLIVFPSIFKGAHIGHTEMVQIHTGHEIKVEFDRPCALQIDGETILDVKEYSVSVNVPAKV